MTEESFSKGDWIVHSNHGVGQVKGIEKKELDGVKHSYFRVRTSNCVYWLLEKNVEVPHIRPLVSRYKINKALSILRKKPKPLPKDYKIREMAIKEMISDSSIYSKARLIRDLYGRKYTAKLNQTDIDVLEKIKKQFLNEWSLIGDKDVDELSVNLSELLKKSVKKLEDGANI